MIHHLLGEPPPPPPGVKAVRGPRGVKWVIFLALVLVIVAASNWIPVPIFYAYQPGPVKNVEDLIDVGDAKSYSSEGRLLLTTVSVEVDVTLRDLVAAVFDPETTVVPRDDVTGGGTLEQLERQQRAEMEESKQSAEEVALTSLGIAEAEGKGARIRQTLDDSPAEGVLQAGDVIVEINGQEASTMCDVGHFIDDTHVGDEIEITVVRDGRRETLSLETGPHPQDRNHPYVGIVMEDVGYRFEPGFDVEIKTGEIAGPSAGLMFALALYDRLTAEDLTAGKDVAGTGTISCDGGVGAIGGIEQKVAAAEAEGAEIFLAPAANASDAQRVADEIEIVAVNEFDDAVDYLEGLE